MKKMALLNYIIVSLGASAFLLSVQFNMILLAGAGALIAVVMLALSFVGKRKMESAGMSYQVQLLHSHFQHLFRTQLVTLLICVAGLLAGLVSESLGLGVILVAQVWFLSRALHGLGMLREGCPLISGQGDDD